MNLREIRKKHNLTLKELADYLNVSESAISQYENNKREPDYNTLCKLADFFQVTIDYLLGRDNIEKKPTEISVDPRIVLGLKSYGLSLEDLNKLSDEQIQLIANIVNQMKGKGE